MDSEKILAVFDFDHTLIELNTDAEVQKLSPGGSLPQEVHSLRRSMGWTEFMQQVFTHLNKESVKSDEIKKFIRSLEFTPGAGELIRTLKEDLNAEIIIISDSNTLFISELLDESGLTGYFAQVFTHPAEFDPQTNCLQIKRTNPEIVCKEGKGKMCKGHILDSYIKQRSKEGQKFDKVVYVGDGVNDFCPITSLASTDLAFVRKGFGLEKHLAEKSNSDRINAKVVLWSEISTVSTVLKQ